MAKIFKAPKRKPKAARKKHLNQRLEVTIDSVDHKGTGVARVDGEVIFVDGALPSEVCEVRVTEQKNRFRQAVVKTVSQASPLRQTPFCEHFSVCGGCQTQYAQPVGMLALKQQAVDALLTRKGIPGPLPWLSPLAGESKGYRRKTRLAVDARDKGNVKVGFRQKQSKDVIHLNGCEILQKDLQRLLSPIQGLVQGLNTPSAIGHINLSSGSDFVQVCLRVTKTLGEADRKALVSFSDEHQCQLLLEDKQGNFENVSSETSSLSYTLDGQVSITFEPNDFIQVNDDINRRMVAQAIEWLELNKGDTVVDLFCGVGNFSVAVAKHCKDVIGVEGVSDMVQRATFNAQQNTIDNALFVQDDLNAADGKEVDKLVRANKVLLDPAREGASGTIELLKSVAASHILYVSCNPSTFARDAEHILQLGYGLSRIGLMDMFPNTAHTELMALFVPGKKIKN